MKTPTKFAVLKLAAVALMVICSPPKVSAGLINNVLRPDGFGKVGINMVYNGTSKTVTTATNGLATSLRSGAYVKQPFAAIGIVVSNTYKSYAPLPTGFPEGNFYQVKSSGSLFSINYNLTDGATADNAEFERRLPIDPAECVSGNLEARLDIDPTSNTGKIVLSGTQTAGAGIWMRLYEYDEDAPGNLPVPEDDPNTPEVDEGLEFIKANGTLKHDLATSGPSDFTTDCNAVKIPITFQNRDDLYFIVDTLAKSLPFILNCPNDVVVECGTPVVYEVTYANCGNVTFTYDPPRDHSFPIGTTPVTVTATDTYGNIKTCTFNVIVKDTVIPVLTGQGGPSAPLEYPATPVFTAPTAMDCDPSVSISYKDVTIPGTCAGNYTVTRTWIATDSSANASLPVSQTITVQDTTKPTLAGVPAGLTVEYPAVPAAASPTASDTCDPSPLVSLNETSTQGSDVNTVGHYNYTITRTWTATDACGNQSSATQVITVKDTTKPVPTVASLPPVNGSCSGPVSGITPPTATDNSGLLVTGATTTTFPITALGQTVVTWTFTDVSGNQSSQTQTVNITGLTFQGFYSPVGTVNNSVANAVSRTAGASFPLKWDILCGSSYISGGTPPTVDIQQIDTAGNPVGAATRLTAEYQNDWHINWPTSSAARNKLYKAIVNLADGTKPYVIVKFK